MAKGFVAHEDSPNGCLQATVEQDERVVYFYLHGKEGTDYKMRSCWVRNLEPAPLGGEVESMQQGEAPMLPKGFCFRPDGAPPVKPTDIRFLWFLDGDGAALVEGTKLLAIIPPASDTNDCSGYSAECLRKGPLAWPLNDDAFTTYKNRFDAAIDFWNDWEEPLGLWPRIQEEILSAYELQLGSRDKYYAVDSGQWPPRAVVRLDGGDFFSLATLGVCIQQQPTIEKDVRPAKRIRRIELGFALQKSHGDAVTVEIAKTLSGLTAVPWRHFTWFGVGHTVPLSIQGLPAAPTGERYVAGLLVTTSPTGGVIELPKFRGDPVNALWIVPITDRERTLAMERGSEALVNKLTEEGRTSVFGA